MKTHLRLTNSRFRVLYVKMNNFEAHLVVSSRVVDSKVLGMAIKFEYFFWSKGKMANLMLEILDGLYFYESWCAGIQSLRFYKWLQILNWSKWISEVDIQTQSLLTLLIFIALQICEKKKSICRRWLLFGVIYCVNFQFTPWRVING